eukprot:7649396-Lingulodinium_polyedra.AAC.1
MVDSPEFARVFCVVDISLCPPEYSTGWPRACSGTPRWIVHSDREYSTWWVALGLLGYPTGWIAQRCRVPPPAGGP